MPNGDIELDWGDGTYRFNIARIEQLLELEEKCAAGVAVIFNRLRGGAYYVNDLRETIRLGLIGGGLEPAKATALMRRYFDARPLVEAWMPAIAILTAAMVGSLDDGKGEEEPVGKKPVPEEAPAASSPGMGASAEANSTASAPPSDSLPATSIVSRSGNSPPASTV